MLTSWFLSSSFFLFLLFPFRTVCDIQSSELRTLWIHSSLRRPFRHMGNQTSRQTIAKTESKTKQLVWIIDKPRGLAQPMQETAASAGEGAPRSATGSE
jgi:hypothetical protein